MIAAASTDDGCDDTKLDDDNGKSHNMFIIRVLEAAAAAAMRLRHTLWKLPIISQHLDGIWESDRRKAYVVSVC